MQSKVRTFLCISAILTIAAGTATAQDKPLHLPLASEISKAEVILTADRITSIRPIREQDLPNNGCTFTTSDSEEKKAKLISIVESNFAQAQQQPVSLLRNAIYLHLKNGDKVKILLSDSYQPVDRVIGNININGSGESLTVTSSGRLLKQLREWATSGVDRHNFSDYCIN